MALEKPVSADSFIGTMAEKLGAVARAATIFAEPVERDGVTVIPVSKARWGFGGGVGHRKAGGAQREEDGAGGGGGVQVTPVGFIEIRNGQAEFRRIRTVSLPLDDCRRYLDSLSATSNVEAVVVTDILPLFSDLSASALISGLI